MRSTWYTIILGVLACLPAGAQGGARKEDTAPAAANVITPAEAAKGWIQLFDGTTDFGWKSRGDSKWNVADGTLQASEGQAGMLSTTTEFSDFELSAEVWIDDKCN